MTVQEEMGTNQFESDWEPWPQQMGARDHFKMVVLMLSGICIALACAVDGERRVTDEDRPAHKYFIKVNKVRHIC